MIRLRRGASSCYVNMMARASDLRWSLLLAGALGACGASDEAGDRASALPVQVLEIPGACARVGRVYFFSADSSLDPVELTERYRAEYGLPADALPAISPNAATAEEVLAEVRRVNGALAAGMGVLVGVTDVESEDGSLFLVDDTIALASTASLGSSTNSAALYARTYKLLTHLLGRTYCRFAPNQNPRSVMYRELHSPMDLDRADESIW